MLLNTTSANAMTINLQQAIEMALENSRSIEQSEEDRDIARWNLSAVRISAEPKTEVNKLEGSYYRPYRNSSLYSDYKREMTNNITASMPIYSGGKLEAKRRSAELALNESDLILENTRQTVKYKTAEAYYKVMQSKDVIKVQEEAVEVLNKHLDNLKIQ